MLCSLAYFCCCAENNLIMVGHRLTGSFQDFDCYKIAYIGDFAENLPKGFHPFRQTLPKILLWKLICETTSFGFGQNFQIFCITFNIICSILVL